MEHAIEAIGKFGARRNLIRNACCPDLRFCAHDSLGQRRRGCQKRVRDFFGSKAAHFAQRQRDLCVRAESGVTAGEDKPEAVVLEVIVIPRWVGNCFQSVDHRAVDALEACAAAQTIDRLEPASRNEPGARIGRNTVRGPLLDGGRKRVVQRLLGEIEIIEKADERSEHTARLGSIESIDLIAHVRRTLLVHLRRAAAG